MQIQSNKNKNRGQLKNQFLRFSMFFIVFNGFEWLKWLFEPIRIDLDKVSAQTVDSGHKS